MWHECIGFVFSVCDWGKRQFTQISGQVKSAASGLWQLVLSIWHGSIKWGWFAVLVLGAVGMISIGEHGFGLLLIALAAFSVTSKLWHQQNIHWFLRSMGTVGILFACVLCFFIARVIKGSAPWSHLPEGWNSMLIASTLKLETINLSAPPQPVPPKGIFYIHPTPIPSRKRARLTVTSVVGLQGKAVGDKSKIEIRIKSGESSAIKAKMWVEVAEEPFQEDTPTNWTTQDQLWVQLLKFATDTSAVPQTIPSNNDSIAIPLETNAIDQRDVDNLKAKIFVPYFTVLIKDQSGSLLLEFCAFVRFDGSIGYCKDHNGP